MRSTNVCIKDRPIPLQAGGPITFHCFFFFLFFFFFARRCLTCVVYPTMDHETTSRPPLQDRSQQQILGGYEQIVRGRVEAFGNPSSSSSQQQQQTKPIDEATTKESEKPNNNNNKPTAPLMLRHRPQPLPFILPQPLGPLPTPAQNALSMVPTVRRDFLPASFPPTEYQRDLERHPRPGPTNSGSGMRQPFPTFLPPPPPPPPDLTRRQSMGSLSSQSPYLPPPLPAYPRRSTSPAFRQSQQQLQQQQQQQQYQQPPVLGSRASVGNLVGWSHHAPAFWPSPPSTSEGSAPGPGIPFPGPPPRPSPRAAEHVRFQCDQCPENFPTNGVLKRHKKTHSARKYRCGCGAAYTDKSVLRVSLKKLQEVREKHTQLKWGAKESNSS